MKKILSIIAFVLPASGCLFAHGYYVSTSNMEYDDVAKRIEVSVKLTAHDFENILETKFAARIHIETIADSSETGLYVQGYLKENFVITSDGKPADFHFIGKEVTLRDELFFYMYFTNVSNPTTIQIKNTLLFTQFPQQQNIVHYKWGSLAKSVTLVSAKPEAELKLE